jgi:hypothetical protein
MFTHGAKLSKCILCIRLTKIHKLKKKIFKISYITRMLQLRFYFKKSPEYKRNMNCNETFTSIAYMFDVTNI